jgi:hypothetical protein
MEEMAAAAAATQPATAPSTAPSPLTPGVGAATSPVSASKPPAATGPSVTIPADLPFTAPPAQQPPTPGK